MKKEIGFAHVEIIMNKEERFYMTETGLGCSFKSNFCKLTLAAFYYKQFFDVFNTLVKNDDIA